MEFDISKMEVIATRPNKVIYRCGDYTVKVFNEDFSKSDILNEALNTARVEETGLPIAKVQQVLQYYYIPKICLNCVYNKYFNKIQYKIQYCFQKNY